MNLLYKLAVLSQCHYYLSLIITNVFYISSLSSMISSDSVLKTANTDYKKMGRRIFAFVIGGATRSEVNILVVTLSTER